MSPYYSEGSLITDTREVSESTTWDTQSDWDAAPATQNAEVVDGSVQLTDFALVDNFEDYPEGPYNQNGETLSDFYSGDMASVSRVTSTVYSGTYSLEIDNGGTNTSISSSSGLPYYPARGDRVRWQSYRSQNNSQVWAAFGTDANNYYQVEVSNSEFFGAELRAYDNGSVVDSTSTSHSDTSGEWWEYTLEIDVDGTDEIRALIEDPIGNTEADLSLTHSGISGGGYVAFGSNGAGGNATTDYHDETFVTNV